MPNTRAVVLWATILLGLSVVIACAVRDLEVKPLDTTATKPIIVSSPVKAHLTDGSTVVFEEGVTVAGGEVTGDGRKYDLTLDKSVRVSSIALDDVAAMESYQTPVNVGQTAGANAVGVPAAVLTGALLAKALFGSCPTTYSMSGDTPVLEAESFSYSIAPSFEARDVDRLNRATGDDGTVELIVRNEALETHYINHLELLEVVHDAADTIVPDTKGRPLEVGHLNAPIMALDRSHRRITGVLDVSDGRSWNSDPAQLRRASLEDFEDYIDLTFDAPRDSKRVALVFRVRNTLLNTVLLYDVMLKDQGFRALDWLGQELDGVFARARLGLWYRDRMGMRVSVWDGDKLRRVARVGDQGPIAWKDVAVILPVLGTDKVRVRLSFVVDNWHIDSVAMSPVIGRPEVRVVPLAHIEVPETGPLEGALENLSMQDERYVVTRPGEALQAKFDVGPAPKGLQRTFLMAAQGYYIEWMRRDWLAEKPITPFEPSDQALLRAIKLWEVKRDTFQRQFESSRIAKQ